MAVLRCIEESSESLPCVMSVAECHEDVRGGTLRVLVIDETEAVEFVLVLVGCAVRLDVICGELDDGALGEVVAVAKCIAARCHDFSCSQGYADGVEALGFVDEASIGLDLWTLSCI